MRVGHPWFKGTLRNHTAPGTVLFASAIVACPAHYMRMILNII
jgi:hypothetical protein